LKIENRGQLPEVKDWVNYENIVCNYGWQAASIRGCRSSDRLFEFIGSNKKQPKAGQATGAPRLGLYHFIIFAANE
jgi:hypothetical protein